MTETKTDGTRKVQQLVLCEYFSNSRKIRRWLRPETVVEVPCRQCGYPDSAYAADAKNHICMDCFAVNEENRGIDGKSTSMT
jgi:hypothetical protein